MIQKKLRTLLICLSILFCFPILAESISENNLLDLSQSHEWLNLLQVDKKGHMHIHEASFYASGYPTTPYQELEELINNPDLKNTSRFPARYEFIQRHLGIDTAYEENPELQEFLHAMENESVSFFFVSPYMGTPMSYFGHTFLKFDRKDNPYFSYIATFVGDNEGLGFWEMITDGLSGEMEGSYSLVPFYRMHQKYVVLEQRTLLEYRLNLQPFEIQKMLLMLYELVGRKMDYHFVLENCTSGIISLVSHARPSLMLAQKQRTITTPIELAALLQKDNLVTSTTSHASTVDDLHLRYSELGRKDKQLLSKLYKDTKKQAFLSQSPVKQELLYLLKEEYIFRFKTKGIYKEDYQDVISLPVRTDIPSSKSLHTSITHRVSYVEASVRMGDQGTSGLVTIRPLYADPWEQSFSTTAKGGLTVGKIGVSFSKEAVELERLDFLSLSAINILGRYASAPSWLLHSGLQRSESTNRLSFTNTLGLGVSLGSSRMYLSFMGKVNMTVFPWDIGLSLDTTAWFDYDKVDTILSLEYPIISLSQGIQYKASALIQCAITDQFMIFAGYTMPHEVFTLGIRYRFSLFSLF